MTRQQPGARTVRLADLREGDYLQERHATVTDTSIVGNVWPSQVRVIVGLTGGNSLVGHPDDREVVL